MLTPPRLKMSSNDGTPFIVFIIIRKQNSLTWLAIKLFASRPINDFILLISFFFLVHFCFKQLLCLFNYVFILGLAKYVHFMGLYFRHYGGYFVIITNLLCSSVKYFDDRICTQLTSCLPCHFSDLTMPISSPIICITQYCFSDKPLVMKTQDKTEHKAVWDSNQNFGECGGKIFQLILILWFYKLALCVWHPGIVIVSFQI